MKIVVALNQTSGQAFVSDLLGIGLDIQGGGSLKMGFFGDTPVVQQSVGADTLANLYTALRNYGLIA